MDFTSRNLSFYRWARKSAEKGTSMKCNRKKCQNEIPKTRRSDAKYCSPKCQKRDGVLRYHKRLFTSARIWKPGHTELRNAV